MRIIAGEEPADEGVVGFARGLRLGYLPQEAARKAGVTVLARLLDGRAKLVSMGEELEHIAARMSESSPEEAAALSLRHAELSAEYRHRGGPELRGRAREILRGLGLGEEDEGRSLEALSGGMAMRVELGRLLLSAPDLLLLDEPTNHLDMASLDWLEDFLLSYRGACVVVSHDRYFLNRMVKSVAELSPRGLLVFSGNYDDYLVARDELMARLAEERDATRRQMAELQQFVDRFRAKASKARQAQSRVKQITKLKSELTKAELRAPPPRSTRRVKLDLDPPARSGDTVAELSKVSKRFGDKEIYREVDFVIRRKERVALVGENGAGKSTLLKILAGVLAHDGGERRLGHNVETYYFAQHQSEALCAERTVLEELRALLPLAEETRVRGILGAFLFSGEAVDKKVAVLSGGEKSRLVLAKMLARPANFLLLDEPTNHLDLPARDVVEGALAAFEGTICFISHDRYFIDRVATSVVEVAPGGRLTPYAGDYGYYLWKKQQEEGATTRAAATVAREERPSARASEREAKKATERELRRREKEANRIEAEIARVEARLAAVDHELCDLATCGRLEELTALTRERCELEESLPALYDAL